MPCEILENVYLIEIPMPQDLFENLNCYFIRGEERSLLIDTGLNLDCCYESLMDGLDKLNAKIERTDIFLTHFHADHAGLCGRLAAPDTRMFIGAADRDIIKMIIQGSYIDLHNMISLGFSEDLISESKKLIRETPYGCVPADALVTVEDGHIFDIGKFRLRAISTPGHTPGHISLYDEERKLLFCGDHIISDISPSISIFPGTPCSLGQYLDSLRNIRTLKTDIALPAHRTPIRNLPSRIDELLKHHEYKLAEMMDIVKKYPGSSCYEIASQIKWNISVKVWDEFPFLQKFLAVTETAAHLVFLCRESKLRTETQNDVLRYY